MKQPDLSNFSVSKNNSRSLDLLKTYSRAFLLSEERPSLFRLMNKISLFFILALRLHAADSVVTFNEIHYNPEGPSEGQEWIELHNQMAINVDLSGWQLTGGIDFVIPEGTTISGGGFYLIAKEPKNPALAGANVDGPFAGSLSNSGETVRLRSRSKRIMDEVDYSDSGQWPVGPDGSGSTLAKSDDSLLSGKSSSWTTSSQIGGTPGATNFSTANLPIPHVFIASDASWKFDDSGSMPSQNWNRTSYNDATWNSGQTLFGTTSEDGGPTILPVIDHLVERFRASDLALSNGQIVSNWPDTATADGQAQTATARGNPTFARNATPSGQPAVRFDGNDQLRTSIAPGIGNTSGFVFFAVIKANSNPGNGGIGNGSGPYIWDRDSSISDPPLTSLKSDGGRYGLQKRYNNGSGLGGPISSTLISTSDYQIVAIRRNRSENQFELWVDGVLESTDNDSGAALTPQPIVIGNHSGGAGGFDGDIAELLIYEDELTNSEFESIGAYLESRYGLDTAFPGNGSAPATELQDNGATTYIRQTFNYNGDPNNTSIRIDHLVSDGAVIYLNGSEIRRINMPAGAINHNSTALSDISAPISSGFINLPNASLLNGTNVLAVSLHPAPGNTSVSFASTLEGTETPPDPSTNPGLIFNEVSSAKDLNFFVEVTNPGSTPVSTNGYTLKIEGDSTTIVDLPNQTLNHGEILLLDHTALGHSPSANDKLFLFSSGGTSLTDARGVTNRLRGLSPEFPDRWIFPSKPTPGIANSFALNTDIVINEICYNPPILDSDPGVPPTIDTIPLIDSGASWRYNEKGDALPTDWASQPHSIGGNWESGASTLAYETGINITNLTNPSSNFPRVVTYYFETEFNLTAQEVADLETLILNHRIDDGAIFYLNGEELDRYQMPAGPVDASTFASSSVGNAEWIGDYRVTIPAGSTRVGSNRISVEVHQISLGSSDITFDFEAKAEFVTDPGIPATKSRPGDSQWIELYNRGNQTVDLSGWDFGEGINYTFPEGTKLTANSYLVISNTPSTLARQYPNITILGPFDGNLSRRSETITLRDQYNNPSDTLRYFDGGAWPSKADAGGSTMELIDARADNAQPGAWAGSDELSRTSWQTYTFRTTASSSPVGNDNQWREFIFGLLEEGEILLDDLTVTEDPDGSAISMITNGTFNNLNTWRALGNHRDVEIIPDPDGDGSVLYLKAIGSTEHQHNHVEANLVNNRRVTNGRVYEVSFRARWLSGSHLLHTRLYFNRIPHTFHLERPDLYGTPGTQNSTVVSNAGPTSSDLYHFPVVPAPGESVTISANVTDPNGVENLTLHYRVEGGEFTATSMSQIGNSAKWEGSIPGQSSGNVVQFYLTSTDTLGASSFLPAEGPDSRAMYEVEDGRAATTGCINNFRIIMDPDDLTWMFTPRNLMSNGRVPCTVIDREGKAYYNTGVRIKGSQRARGQRNRVGFNVGFPSDQLFRNVHRSVAIDRSEGQVVGQREILFDLMATSSGGIPGEFNDLAYVISPNPIHTSAAVLQMARFGSVFLEDQFDNGSDGTVYEYELVYYPTTTDAGGYKVPEPDRVVGRDINDMGEDPEAYRWTYLIKNNQEFGDYQPAMALGKQFSKPTADFNTSVADVLDVDQWLRALAYSCASGAGDSFYSNSNHNGQFYGRPDGKVLYFPHDIDFAFSSSRGIFENSELNRIINNQSYRRSYLAHLYDICSTVYNREWMAPWTAHFDECVPGGNVFSDDLSYINSRSNYILNQVNRQVSPINFSITTNGGNNFTTSDTPVILAGTGWLDIHEIRLSNGTPVTHNWTSTDDWELALTLGIGVHSITLEAYDSRGNLLGSDGITITRSGGLDTPSIASLAVSEVYYNPSGQDEGSEFVELLNVGDSSLDLSGTRFTDGIDFTFPVSSVLAPGKRILVVANRTTFKDRYGTGLPIAGEFKNGTSLSNKGELITLRDNTGIVIQSFTYDDSPPWPQEADGDDFSLVLLNPNSTPDHTLASNWRASALTGGNPGDNDVCPDFVGPALIDRDLDGVPALIEYFLGTSDNHVGDSNSKLSYSTTNEAGQTFPTYTVTHKVGTDAVNANAEVSFNLQSWSSLATDIVLHRRVSNGDGTVTSTWRSTKTLSPTIRQFFRLRAILK